MSEADDELATDERHGAERVRLGDDDGRLALVVDGVVQSVAVGKGLPDTGYWSAMVPDVRPQSTLLLGLGAGTVAQLLVERFGPVSIVGVEREPAVVALAKARLGLDLPNVEIVVEDAFAFVNRCARRFDFICVDLYDGPTLARGALAKPFLRRVRALLSPSGCAVFNLVLTRRLPQQLRRLTEAFRVTRTVDVELNLVVFCQAA